MKTRNYSQKVQSVYLPYGIDFLKFKDTALLVTSENDGSNVVGDVMGAGGVFFADLKDAKESAVE
jgi:hypothetical protein